MPKQKDLKRVVRTRMQKTGESYTAARRQVLRKREPAPSYAEVAGRSDATVKLRTGRNWSEWVALLDGRKAALWPHREIAAYVSSIGTPDWWSQTVTVGYERIRGLRELGQRRDGAYDVTKSRTLAVPITKLFAAFARPRVRARWLPRVNVRSASPNKRMRLDMHDGSVVELGFTSKGSAKSTVAVLHTLSDKATAAKMKLWWGERLDALAAILDASP